MNFSSNSVNLLYDRVHHDRGRAPRHHGHVLRDHQLQLLLNSIRQGFHDCHG
ncbi:hypothetical protein [Cytobacillus purgationiresistens]|uniref:hypothetical protein n=1 Tax=Cytobacillus purgationiresistens TaxID=863449 RepID=UPI0027D8CFAC|nr:hypothetical protein [Cytobacillus purgationiresistens]